MWVVMHVLGMSYVVWALGMSYVGPRYVSGGSYVIWVLGMKTRQVPIHLWTVSPVQQNIVMPWGILFLTSSC